MTAVATAARQFVRRTQLGPNEYRKNFRQIDGDVIAAVTSEEADRVTPLMSKIYLRLVSAPVEFWEGEGVLHFIARGEQGRTVKASKVLYELLGVSSATAHKALAWMHEKGVIGYYAGKNGVGIRIFINRAASSIGVRRAATAGEKILPFAHGSNGERRGSRNEPAFIAPSGDLESLEKDINPAPASGAEGTPAVDCALAPSAVSSLTLTISRGQPQHEAGIERYPAVPPPLPVEEVVSRIRAELEPHLTQVAVRAAGRAAQQEVEGQRAWFEKKALPKAVRVAQRETFDLLRKQGLTDESPNRRRADAEVGRRREPAAPTACTLSDAEVRETAETCVALFETQGRPVEATLQELSAEGGGLLPAEDVPRVRAEVERMLRATAEEVTGDGGK